MAHDTTTLLDRKQYIVSIPKQQCAEEEAALTQVLNSPPIIKVGGLLFIPHRRADKHSLSAAHSTAFWRWNITAWDQISDSFYKERVTKKRVKELLAALPEENEDSK